MIYCRNCGQFSEDDQSFCRNCGTSLGIVSNAKKQKVDPPKPYSWADDSPYVPPKKNPMTTNPTILQVQPLSNQSMQMQPQNTQSFYQGYRCPRCQTHALPQYTQKVSQAGWIIMIVLIFAFFPLFWIGFLIKEEKRVCPMCLYELN